MDIKSWRNIGLGMVVGLLAAGLILLVGSPVRGLPIRLQPAATIAPPTIYITGEITHPGVYTLPPHSRVSNAVDAAGGTLPSANNEAVNFAEVIWDGQRIVIPAKVEPSANSSDNSQDGIPTPSPANPLNINTATLEELQLLPGIGVTKAQNILDYRKQHGNFNTIEELLEVSGIGPGIFDKIKDRITTGGIQ